MPTIIPLTKEETWLSWIGSERNPEAWQPPRVPTLVIAPHPDDETLGAGGLIARLRAEDVPVTVACVTNGENAYSQDEAVELGRLRVSEQQQALTRLGITSTMTRRLHLPDSDVTLHEDQLVDSLRKLAGFGMHVVAPWPGDFHPDHEAAGRAAQRIAAELQLPLTFYLFWAWHRGSPSTLANVSIKKLVLTKDEQEVKEHALQAHASQLWREDGQPILSKVLLRPARRNFEVYLRP